MSELNIEQRVAQLEERVNVVESSVKNLGGNLKFLRDLTEECVHLTEQSSGIVVEHVSTLDARLDSIGGIFADKIKRQLGEAGSVAEKLNVVATGLEDLEKSLEHLGISKVATATAE